VQQEIEPAARAAHVPPLILQPLVENAIRHGLADDSVPVGLIQVSARTTNGRVHIEICNRVSAAAGKLREGRGLSVVRRRLERAFGTQATLQLDRENGCVLARLGIPLRTVDRC
jgi:two-component system sensor histidine kinase AlgZ